MTIDQKIESCDKRIDEALEKLQSIAEFKVADRITVKDFNRKVQALNYCRKLHKYGNMGELY
jgi:hypothetical protein